VAATEIRVTAIIPQVCAVVRAASAPVTACAYQRRVGAGRSHADEPAAGVAPRYRARTRLGLPRAWPSRCGGSLPATTSTMCEASSGSGRPESASRSEACHSPSILKAAPWYSIPSFSAQRPARVGLRTRRKPRRGVAGDRWTFRNPCKQHSTFELVENRFCICSPRSGWRRRRAECRRRSRLSPGGGQCRGQVGRTVAGSGNRTSSRLDPGRLRGDSLGGVGREVIDISFRKASSPNFRRSASKNKTPWRSPVGSWWNRSPGRV